MIIQSEPVRAWCRSCRNRVTLVNVRPWPEGVLVVGECPKCRASLASRKPIGWAGPDEARSASAPRVHASREA